MFELRPRYFNLLYSLPLVALGIGFFIMAAYGGGAKVVAMGVLFLIAAAIVFYCIFRYIKKHTLKFNTQEIEVGGVCYQIEELKIGQAPAINNLTVQNSPLEIRHKGELIFTFQRHYTHFWDFKAVIEAKGFHLDYF